MDPNFFATIQQAIANGYDPNILFQMMPYPPVPKPIEPAPEYHRCDHCHHRCYGVKLHRDRSRSRRDRSRSRHRRRDGSKSPDRRRDRSRSHHRHSRRDGSKSPDRRRDGSRSRDRSESPDRSASAERQEYLEALKKNTERKNRSLQDFIDEETKSPIRYYDGMCVIDHFTKIQSPIKTPKKYILGVWKDRYITTSIQKVFSDDPIELVDEDDRLIIDEEKIADPHNFQLVFEVGPRVYRTTKYVSRTLSAVAYIKKTIEARKGFDRELWSKNVEIFCYKFYPDMR